MNLATLKCVVKLKSSDLVVTKPCAFDPKRQQLSCNHEDTSDNSLVFQVLQSQHLIGQLSNAHLCVKKRNRSKYLGICWGSTSMTSHRFEKPSNTVCSSTVIYKG